MSTWIHLLLLLLLPIICAAESKQWNDLTHEEKNASIWIIIFCVAGAIGLSISAAGGAFFVMSRRNRNQGDQVMVVR
ncbi:hypothetical protein B9Z55_012283 [Caenorhabditis nigoni]|uniref:Uncharacterized protein n=1 Tax=Caenorhabditis nigoni TaxID=1611254 RepID=A0A2G5TWG3_9PELO|nr:hypothetical protein B9Z55_012283 [Caenorhabditis nigoni]